MLRGGSKALKNSYWWPKQNEIFFDGKNPVYGILRAKWQMISLWEIFTAK